MTITPRDKKIMSVAKLEAHLEQIADTRIQLLILLDDLLTDLPEEWTTDRAIDQVYQGEDNPSFLETTEQIDSAPAGTLLSTRDGELNGFKRADGSWLVNFRRGVHKPVEIWAQNIKHVVRWGYGPQQEPHHD